MSAGSWSDFVYNIQNQWYKTSGTHKVKNVCQHAAIVGLEGAVWAASSAWPGFHEYDHACENEDGSTVNIKMKEIESVLAAIKGNRNPTKAGIRMNKTKFVYVTHDADANMVILSKQGGGATIVKTNKALVIGVWDKDTQRSDGQPQDGGTCTMMTERVAKFMKEQGF